jgi:hypothetical protein
VEGVKDGKWRHTVDPNVIDAYVEKAANILNTTSLLSVLKEIRDIRAQNDIFVLQKHLSVHPIKRILIIADKGGLNLELGREAILKDKL